MENRKSRFSHIWRSTPPVKGSYRSIFKWGAPEEYKHPNDKLFKEMMATFNIDESHFKETVTTGDEPVSFRSPVNTNRKHRYLMNLSMRL